MGVEVRLLGRFEVRVDGRALPATGWGRRQAASLVKLLALAPGQQIHRERLLDALWPDVPVDGAAPRLHKIAHYARRAFGDRDSVVLRGEMVALCPGQQIVVDAHVFEELAGRAVADGDPTAAAAAAAAAAYGGELLPEDLYEPWAESARERLRLLHLRLLRKAGLWEQLLAAEPADEEAHLALMRDYLQRSDRRAVLRQFERMDRALRRELGVGPGDEAVAVRDAALADVPGAARTARAARAARAVRAELSGTDELIGRERELHTIDRLLADASAGQGRTVLVCGPAGVGKSSLLTVALTQAVDRGWLVGRGLAAAVEGAWPYAPVLEALADLCRRHPTLLDGLDDSYRAEIERAMSGRELGWAGVSGHQRLFVATAELLRLAAAESGVMVVVDDVHEADDATLRLLHYLARCSLGQRVLLVLAHRSGPSADSVEQIRASMIGRAVAVELGLAPLDRPAVERLLKRHLPQPSPQVVEQIWVVSQGLPFSALELARQAAEDPAGTLGPAVLAGLAGLPRHLRDLLPRIAIAGLTFDTDEFVALSNLAEPDAYAALDAALATGAVELGESGYRFRHRLIRDALLADLAPHRQRLVHREAADRLAALGASPARVGHHLISAGDHAAAVPYVLRAAETEAAVGAYRDALGLVDSVRSHATGAQAVRVRGLRADLLVAIGDPAAVGAYREALEVAVTPGGLEDDSNGNTDPGTVRALRGRMARAAVMSGDIDTAAAALDGLTPDGGAADAAILLVQGNLAYFRGDLDTAWTVAQEARRRILPGDTDWQMFDLVALQGLIAHNRGEWFERLRIELRQTRQAPRLASVVFDSHLCVAEYLLYGPTPYAEVISLARTLRASAHRSGALRAVAFAAALTGEAALLAGDLDLAETELQEAVDLHREIGATAGEAHSLQRLAEVRIARGDRAGAEVLLHRALLLARWSSIASHLLQRIYGTMIAVAADADAARAAVDQAEAMFGQEDRCYFCNVMLAVPAAIACADFGDLDRARRHLAAAERSAALWEGTAWQAAIHEARAHVAAAAGDQARASQLLAEAARRFEYAGQPLDTARCQLGTPSRTPFPPGRTIS